MIQLAGGSVKKITWMRQILYFYNNIYRDNNIMSFFILEFHNSHEIEYKNPFRLLLSNKGQLKVKI